MSVELSKLPSIAKAKLPVNYQAAKKALAQCVKIDECKDWMDKSAALASYAKQIDDKEMEKNARRIRARANDQCGKLLRKIKPQPGARTDKPNRGTPTRSKAASEAGLSKDQAATALRVNAVPSESFEAQVESDDPPSVTDLAKQGTKKRSVTDHIVEDVLRGRDPDDFKALGVLSGSISYFLERIPAINLERAVRAIEPWQRPEILAQAKQVAAWATGVIALLENINVTIQQGRPQTEDQPAD
jgi:hypothetical protein